MPVRDLRDPKAVGTVLLAYGSDTLRGDRPLSEIADSVLRGPFPNVPPHESPVEKYDRRTEVIVETITRRVPRGGDTSPIARLAGG